jgi:hypothetical protein
MTGWAGRKDAPCGRNAEHPLQPYLAYPEKEAKVTNIFSNYYALRGHEIVNSTR